MLRCFVGIQVTLTLEIRGLSLFGLWVKSRLLLDWFWRLNNGFVLLCDNSLAVNALWINVDALSLPRPHGISSKPIMLLHTWTSHSLRDFTFCLEKLGRLVIAHVHQVTSTRGESMDSLPFTLVMVEYLCSTLRMHGCLWTVCGLSIEVTAFALLWLVYFLRLH